MFVQRNLAFDEHAEQGKTCSLCGRGPAWVETYTSDEIRGEFSLDDFCHMFNLHRKVYIGQPFGRAVIDAITYYLSKYRDDYERGGEPVTFYWESKGGFLSAPYLLIGFASTQKKILGDRKALDASIIYTGDSSGGGAYAALAFDKDRRRILPDARVNFYAERKPVNHKDDEVFNRHAEICISMSDEFARESKWSAEEMEEMMKNIHSSYKYLYAVEGVPKTFFDFFAIQLGEAIGKSKEEAEKIMSEDRWWTAQELCDLGYFDELLEPNERIKKDLGFIKPSST